MYSEFLWFIVYTFDHLAVGTTNPNVFYDCHITLTTYRGALTDDYKLSDPVGHQMARLPLDPMYSKALIVSSKFKCLEEMLIVVSMLSVESIFFSVREKLEEVSI